jgi:general stress protein 26
MQDPTRQDEHEGTVVRLLESVRATIRATPYCFLINLGPAGVPRTRLMGHLEPEGGMTVWMVSPPQASKVLDLQRENRATLVYADMAGRGYVTLTGQARLVSDPKLRGGRWKERWSQWFSGGAQDVDSLLSP